MPGGRLYSAGLIGLMAVLGIGFVIALVVSGEVIGMFGLMVALWLAVVAWNGYWFLFRISSELELGGSTLVAKTVRSARSIQLSELTAIRPTRMLPTFVTIEVRDQRNIMTMANKGFADFASAISDQEPGLTVRVGLLAKVAQAGPGWNGLQHR